MGFLIIIGGVAGVAAGLIAGGIVGFLKAKRQETRKFLWIVCGMLAGALALGVAGLGISWVIIAA